MTDGPFAYATLRVIWWLILGVLLIGFAIMDGFDLGVGASVTYLGRSDAERRAVLLSVEPVWEGNQVWFILGGGAAFAAWPLLYATSFSGLYLAMLLLLMALILRPVGFGFRDKVQNARWRSAWDGALTVGGGVPALLFGVAFGNLFLGIPFHFDSLQRPVVGGGFFSLLHPFALLAGIVSLSMLVLQGNAYAAMKVGEPMAARARTLGRAASAIFIVCFLAAGIWVYSALPGYQVSGPLDHSGPSDPMRKTVAIVTGAWLNNFHHRPVFWLAPILALLGAVGAHVFLHMREARAAFVASTLVQVATILTAGIALFPFLMPSSTYPNQSLTVWDSSSSAKTLLIMLAVVVIFLPIVLAYTAWVFSVLRGRINVEDVQEHEGGY
ncbi:MAG TPA: cytochrome d ubiquinol oxidase subunit II [Steroidobacteraceae bacterium]|jgi:cytochrome d ubiquinol oxidase subunit II